MADEEGTGKREWNCQRCTALNDKNNKYCAQCLGPKDVSFPNLPEELPIPEFSNPYPEKEFINEQESFAAAHTPKRREQPAEQRSVMDSHGSSETHFQFSNELDQPPKDDEPEDSDLNFEPNQIGELPLTFERSDSEDSEDRNLYGQGSPIDGSSMPGAETMDSSEFRLSPIAFKSEENDSELLTESQNNDDIDMEEFRLPPLTGADISDETVTQPITSPPTFSSTAPVVTLTNAIARHHPILHDHQSSPSSVEDLMEQSASGFHVRDFVAPPHTEHSGNTEVKIQDPVMPYVLLDLSTNRSKPPETGLPQMKPVDVAEHAANQKRQGPYSRIDDIRLQSARPGHPNSLQNFQEPQRSLIPSGVAIDLSKIPPSPKHPCPPGLSPPGSSTTPSVPQQQLKKVKPVKSNRPIPNLGSSVDPQISLSNNEILSLFDPSGSHLTPTSEKPPEVASVRSATFTSAAAPSIDDPSFFDPYATPKMPNFKDEHYGNDSKPVQEESLGRSTSSQGETVPTTTTTTSVASGGARRKIPRPQPSSGVQTQTRLYTGPSTSRRAPPPEPMELDASGKWPCPLCTFANRVSAQYCEMCHEGRPPWYTGETMSPISSPTAPPLQNEQVVQHGQREVKSKAFVDEWVCQNCTRSNRPQDEVCMTCDTPRPRGFALPGRPGSPLRTEPKQTMAVPQDPDVPSTSRQQMELAVPLTSRPSTSRQHSLSENLLSLRTSSIGSITSGSAVRSIAMEQVRKDQEKPALEIFHNIIAYCQQADEKFIDDQFFPSQRSLQFPNAAYDHNIASAVWLRPHQINSGDLNNHHRDWTIFCAEGPATTDIQQGILGNCWFLSGLSVLVERPQLLRKIFITSEYSKYGAYMIRLCKDGVWQTVIIDDLLPCNNQGELLYTQSKKKQLWVPLIEKALAKAHGCYEALQAGRSIEGLATLTGAPCESLQLVAGPDLIQPEPDMIWVRLLSAREAGYLMGASCGGANLDVDERIYDEVDLRVRHAYSVLDVRIEKMDSGQAVKLLQLRNPWAQQSWSGQWSDRDAVWYNNPRLAGKLDPNHSQHGIFWLSFDDMLRYFDSVDICKIRDNKWSEIRTEGDFPDSALYPPSSFFLEVFQSTEIDLSIFQQGSRSQEGSGRHPVDLCICVFRSSELAARSSQGAEVVLGPLVECSRRQVKRHGSCCHFFEPGVYQVVTLAFNHWMSAFGSSVASGSGAAAFGAEAAPMEHPKFVLALHSSRAISLSQFKGHPLLLADATIELVMKKGEKKDVRECSTCYYLTRGWAGLIVVAENRHPTRHMQIVCDCLDSRNVVSTRGSLKTADCVPPLHKQVIIVLTQLDGHSGFTITHKLVHRMGYEGLGDWSQVPGNHDPPLTPAVEALHKPRPL